MSNDTLPTTPEAVAPFLGKVVDRLAAGTITRDDAIALLDAITGDSSDTLWTDAEDDQRSRTRESWIRIFDSRLQERNRAANAGASRATDPASGTDGPNPASSSSGPAPPGPDLRSQATRAMSLIERLQPSPSPAESIIRTFLHSLKDDASGIDKTKFDFAVADSADLPANMHPDAAATLVKAENYSRAVEIARSHLLCNPNKPEFPFSLWNDVLRNQFVDLSKIFSHINSATETTKLSERLGDNISLVSTITRAPTKKIRNFGDWSYVWTRYMRAVVFVFNHRRLELEFWHEHICRLFSTTAEAQHPLVVEMEAAMRRFIFDSPARCLWDVNQVLHLQHAYLSPIGTHSSTRTSGKRANSGDLARPAKKSFSGPPGSSGEESHAPKRRRLEPQDPNPGAASRAANQRLGDQSFRRGYLWRDGEESRSPSAESTETALPLPDIPPHELQNTAALETIKNNPHLFAVSTPFNVDRFDFLLKSHPNRPLVDSVLKGLRSGFWPHADTSSFIPNEPETVPNHSLDDQRLTFLKSQRDEELAAGRFSPAFSSLLPGMQSSALGAVPKPHSDKFRLITDQSLGSHALNSFIDKSDVKVRYDNLQDLGRSLRAIRAKFGEVTPLIIWKSDIAHAFRCIPMHPLWQIRQVVEIDGAYHVDRCMVFGNRASPIIWCKVAGLIAWIAINVRRLSFLHHYMDDFWSVERGLTRILYPRYGDLRPHTQVQFLTLLDELDVPHEQRKQVFGEAIPVIGFEVDTRAMSIRMGDEDRERLASELLSFVNDKNRKHPLRRWQSLLGWANWALNALPHARPALASSYSKISEKKIPHATIFINAKVKRDLTWFADRLRSGSGLSLIRANSWDEGKADVTIYCDACPSGLGFWSPSHRRAFYFRCLPEVVRTSNFCEAATIISALQWALSLNLPRFPRILIYSDNLAAVEVFSSMRGYGPYYAMTMQAAAWIHDHDALWRTLHVPGFNNEIADYLSRGMLDRVRALDQSLPIADFTPLPNIYPGSPEM